MLGKGLQLKATALLVSFCEHLEKCGLFFKFQNGFRSSRSTVDLLTRAVALDISKAFKRV